MDVEMGVHSAVIGAGKGKSEAHFALGVWSGDVCGRCCSRGEFLSQPCTYLSKAVPPAHGSLPFTAGSCTTPGNRAVDFRWPSKQLRLRQFEGRDNDLREREHLRWCAWGLYLVLWSFLWNASYGNSASHIHHVWYLKVNSLFKSQLCKYFGGFQVFLFYCFFIEHPHEKMFSN